MLNLHNRRPPNIILITEILSSKPRSPLEILVESKQLLFHYI